MQGIILAGGFATRLWPLTEKTPKPLLPLAGEPLLSHIVGKIPEDIPLHVSTNLAYKEQFEEWKKEFKNRNVEIFIEDSESENEKLGALFSVAHCIEKNKIDEDLLIIAGDNFFDFPIKDFIKSFNESPLLAVFDIKSKKEASKFGVVIGKNGKVQEFQEKPEFPHSTLVSTGLYIIPKNLLKELANYAKNNRDNLGGVFEHFLSKGKSIEYFSFEGKWFDIGSFRAFLEANNTLIGNRVLEKKGVFKKNSSFNGSVFLGENVHVENSLVENSIIMSGAILQNAVIRNSLIGKNAQINGIDLNHKIIRDESFLSF